MKKIPKKLILILQTLVVLSMFGFILFYNLTRSRVIVLHSYSSKVPEVILFNKGFSKIADDLKNPYLVYTYMNMALARSETGRMKLGSRIRAFIRDFNPDILVAVGEEAQEYAARYYLDHEKTRVVFASIRRSSPYGYDQDAEISGVLEVLPMQAIKEVLERNYHSVLEKGSSVSLIFMGDKSFRVTMDREYIFEQAWHPFKVEKFLQMETFDDWRHEIEMLKKNKGPAVLFLLGYHHLRAKRGLPEIVSKETVLKWTLSHSPYPVIGLYEGHSKEGVPLCLSGSSKESGEKAASFVQDLIHGKKIKHPHFVRTTRFTVGLNDPQESKTLKVPEAFEVISETQE